MKSKLWNMVLTILGTIVLTFSSGITGECHAFPDDAYTQIPGTMLMRGPSVSDATVANDIEAYQQIPLAIKNMLVGNNIKIYEVDASNGDYSGDAPQTAADKKTFWHYMRSHISYKLLLGLCQRAACANMDRRLC